MGIDVDEVLADFQGSTFPIIHQVTGRQMSKHDWDGTFWDMFSIFTVEERKRIFAECERPGFCANLERNDGAVAAVEELRKHVDLYAVTSHFPSQTWVYERDWWLKRYFGFDRSNIIHTSAKFLVRVDALLDDKPETVVAWQAEHPTGLAMLWPIPNTRNMKEVDSFRVSGWDDVLQRVIKHEVA